MNDRSMIAFIASILSFVWRTTSVSTSPPSSPPSTFSPGGLLAVRIVITSVFGLGMVYFILIVRTLRRYGVSTGGAREGASTPNGMGSSGGGGRGGRSGAGVNKAEQMHMQTRSPRSRGTPRRDVLVSEVDAAMERRGRERQRSVSGSVGARRMRREQAMTMDSGWEENGGQKGGLRAMLGLGLVGLGLKDHEGVGGLDMDLDKG